MRAVVTIRLNAYARRRRAGVRDVPDVSAWSRAVHIHQLWRSRQPTLGKKFVPPTGVTLTKLPYVNDNLGSPAAGDTTLGVERP